MSTPKCECGAKWDIGFENNHLRYCPMHKDNFVPEFSPWAPAIDTSDIEGFWSVGFFIKYSNIGVINEP